MTDNVNSGTFLGYGVSMKTYIYHHIHTANINRATHATIDVAELSSDDTALTPNFRALWNALSRDLGATLASETILELPKDFCVTPLLHISQVLIPIKCKFDEFGLVLDTDPLSKRNIISGARLLSSASHLN
jgi:hypothetical protein